MNSRSVYCHVHSFQTWRLMQGHSLVQCRGFVVGVQVSTWANVLKEEFSMTWRCQRVSKYEENFVFAALSWHRANGTGENQWESTRNKWVWHQQQQSSCSSSSIGALLSCNHPLCQAKWSHDRDGYFSVGCELPVQDMFNKLHINTMGHWCINRQSYTKQWYTTHNETPAIHITELLRQFIDPLKLTSFPQGCRTLWLCCCMNFWWFTVFACPVNQLRLKYWSLLFVENYITNLFLSSCKQLAVKFVRADSEHSLDIKLGQELRNLWQFLLSICNKQITHHRDFNASTMNDTTWFAVIIEEKMAGVVLLYII